MNQKMLISALFLVFIIGAASQYIFSQKSTDAEMMQDEKMVAPTDVMEPPENVMQGDARVNDVDAMKKNDAMMKSDTYVEYSSQAISETANRRVLFFYANWCPTCRPADADFKANMGKIPDDVRLIRVNYNDTDTDGEEKALAAKYNVTYQHTYVQIDASGKELTKWNGGQLRELLSNIK